MSLRRCTARLGTGHCMLEYGHPGLHKALDLSSKLYVEWKSKGEEETFEPRPTQKVKTPITSWRWWRIGRRGILTSITSKSEWLSPVMTTKELSNGELARVSRENPITHGSSSIGPGEDWGVFSYKTPNLFLFLNPGIVSYGRRETLVIGRIDNLGHVVEHAYGLRTQRCIIQELWAFDKDSKLQFATAWRKAVQNRYECDLHIVELEKLNSWAHYYSKGEYEWKPPEL